MTKAFDQEKKSIIQIIEDAKAQVRLQSAVDSQQLEEADATDIWKHDAVSPKEFIKSAHFINDKQGLIWPAIIEDMEVIFSKRDKFGRKSYFPSVHYFLDDEGIGSGKSTKSAIFNAYMAHILLSLRDPLAYFNLFSSSLLFMNVAPTESKAKDIVFSKTMNFINRCAWFRETHNLPEPRLKSMLKFYGHINTQGITERELQELDRLERTGKADTMPTLIIAPGSSAISAVTGADLFMGMVDEACSDDGFETQNEDKAGPIISNMDERRVSRFHDEGMVMAISSAGHEERWMEQEITRVEVFRKMNNIPDSEPITEMDGRRYLVRRRPSYKANPIYNGYFERGDTFTYVAQRETEEGIILEDKLEIPNVFQEKFLREPETSLRNICAISTISVHRWITDWNGLISQINQERSDPCPDNGPDNPLTIQMVKASLPPTWYGNGNTFYYAHIDLATGGTSSSNKDGCGIAIAHRGEDLTRGEGDQKIKMSKVVLDLSIRLKTHGKSTRQNTENGAIVRASESEIKLAEVRDFLIWCHQDRGFKFAKISFDGWQSLDSVQILSDLGYLCDQEPVTNDDYDTLAEIWYDGRLDTYYDKHALWEMRRLERKKNGKIEKSPGSSDDEIECVAKVVKHVVEGEMPEIKKKRATGFATGGLAGRHRNQAPPLPMTKAVVFPGARGGGMPQLPGLPRKR
jgi:hypothetical protein